jgi:hypothetical protein
VTVGVVVSVGEADGLGVEVGENGVSVGGEVSVWEIVVFVGFFSAGGSTSREIAVVGMVGVTICVVAITWIGCDAWNFRFES